MSDKGITLKDFKADQDTVNIVMNEKMEILQVEGLTDDILDQMETSTELKDVAGSLIKCNYYQWL